MDGEGDEMERARKMIIRVFGRSLGGDCLYFSKGLLVFGH